jgi:hypothetical protein
VASAEPDSFTGRWVSAREKLTLDISRCAAGWCGVAVDDGRCGRTVLRLGAGAGDDKSLEGSLQLMPDSKPYVVRAFLHQKDGATAMAIMGNTGDRYALMRRTFEFSGVFARTDAPSCAPDSKVS